MKKLIFTILSLGVLTASNLFAASYWGNTSVKDSMCYYWGYSWTHYKYNNSYYGINQPQANTCYDIRKVGTDLNGWDYSVYGNATTTSVNLEGNLIRIAVDVFGTPTNEPTVMYKYQTLNAVGYENIVNYDSQPAIVNGTRYYFDYYGDVGSGDIIVKHYADYKDQLHVK